MTTGISTASAYRLCGSAPMEKLDIGRLVRFIEEARRVTRILCADQVSGVKQVGGLPPQWGR